MRDFTIRIIELPKEFAQNKDELSMKFAIWNLIQEKIEDLK